MRASFAFSRSAPNSSNSLKYRGAWISAVLFVKVSSDHGPCLAPCPAGNIGPGVGSPDGAGVGSPVGSLVGSFGAPADLDKMLSATSPIMSPYFFATSLSSAGMSFQLAFGVSSLQYAGRHFEIPTHEQLNSPTIHFSSSAGVPSAH